MEKRFPTAYDLLKEKEAKQQQNKLDASDDYIETDTQEDLTFEVKETQKLDDGRHEGTIVDIQYRHEPYEYTDVIIVPDEAKNLNLKIGFPSYLTTTSKLGCLLSLFVEVKAGMSIKPREVLVSRRVSFMTQVEEITTKKNEKMQIVKILENTIKPLNLQE